MENVLKFGVGAYTAVRSARLRTYLIAGFALLVGIVALAAMQRPASAQFPGPGFLQAIVCPILNALAAGPFGGFIGGIINALRAAFGCGVISG